MRSVAMSLQGISILDRVVTMSMSAVDEIEAFIAEVEAALGGADDRFAEMLRRLYRSDDPRVIEICDDACAVIRRRDLSLIGRMIELRPLIARAFGGSL